MSNGECVRNEFSGAVFQRQKTELNWAGMIVGQCKIPACFEGDPGVGKTETLEALAIATRRDFYSYELSRTQPEDLQGFPVVDTYIHNGVSYKYMRFVPDERLLKAELELSLMLLDEVNNVGPAKQAPALNLVQRGLANTWMYMACNPQENAADGQPLTCPFINRIWYGVWEVDDEAQDWGLKNKCVYPLPDVPIVPENYMDYQPRWGSLIVDYFRYNPADRNACPKPEKEKHFPWPSSRTWDRLSKALAAADAVGASPRICEQIVTGLIGQKTGTSFLQYLANLKLPQPEEILANAEDYQLPPRYDVMLAVLTSVVNHLAKQQTAENFQQASKLLKNIKKQNAEMGVAFAGGLRHAMPEFVKDFDRQRLTFV